MGDNDRYDRPRYGNGGGNNRKRRYQDDDSHQRPHQRRRFEPPGTRLRKKLLGLLESSFNVPETDLKEIVTLAVQHGDDEYVRDTFCDLVLSIAMEQPGKSVFVAAAVMGVAKYRTDIAESVVRKVGLHTERSVRAGKWREVKLGLRLLACLQGLFEDDGVLIVLEELFQRTIDLQSANPEETVGPELVKVILYTIPYLVLAAGQEVYDKVDELLQKTNIVASAAHALESLVDPYPSDEPDKKPMACANVLALLQRQLETEAAEGWKLAFLPKALDLDITVSPKKEGEQNGEAEENGDAAMTDTATVTKQGFPVITVPESVNPGRAAIFPEIYYSVFADQDVESVPPTSSLASTLIRDVIVDTVDLVDVNRNFVGKFIIELDNYFAPNTFVKRATGFDKLRDIPEGKPTWKPEDVAIDAIFSQLLRIPAPAHKTVYYHSIIMEACKLAPSAIAPSLGRAIRFTYRTLGELDLELVHRFTDWFAHHVSNFEFRWKWTEWLPEVNESSLDPKKAFILAAIDREIRLSFPKRVADSLPSDFATLIPKGRYNEEPGLKFDDESEPFAQQGKALLAAIKDKATSDEAVQEILDEISSLAASQGTDGAVASTDVLMTCICHVGSKSLSHILSAIEKHRVRLLNIGSASDAARRQIITSVTQYWIHHPGQAVNIIDKLLNYTIVTPQAIIDWSLSDHLDAGAALSRPQVWEMVWATMNKVSRRVGEIAAARADPEMAANAGVIDQTLSTERSAMAALMKQIQDVASGVASGGQGEELAQTSPADAARLQLWGAKWLRVWQRKEAVEMARSGPLGVKALEEVMRVAAQVEAEIKKDEDEDKALKEQARIKREEERRARYEERSREEQRQRAADDGRRREEEDHDVA